MKIFLFILYILVGFTTVKAQVINKLGIDDLFLMTKDSDILNEVEGSPYWNKKFEYGTVTLGNKQPIKAFLRYNANNETVEIKTEQNSEEIYILPLNRNAKYMVANELFVYHEIYYDNKKISGYFIEHHNGEKYKLLEKPTITRSEAVKAKSSYESDTPARITIDSDFYIVSDRSSGKKVKIKNRDIKKAFPSQKAKKFISDHKIREKEDLIALLEFLEQ